MNLKISAYIEMHVENHKVMFQCIAIYFHVSGLQLARLFIQK